ncbi:MAG: cellulose binding domain-containing protein [Anaerolineae bacterium]|nr:cellulose binding domain-containing protein [Anaerolineae bacterium]
MTSIMRRKWLAVATVSILVVLLAATMQAVFALDGTFVTTAGDVDGSWPWESAYGTVAVGDPADAYHAAINHWNPGSLGSISAVVKDGRPSATEAMTLEITDWHDELSGISLDWSTSASVVHWNGTTWEWSPNNPSHAPAAYPDFFQGCHWGQCTWDNGDYGAKDAGMPYPIQVSKIKDLYSTYEIEVTGDAANSTAVWNAAFDIWLDKGERTIQSGWYHTTNWSTPTHEEVYGNWVGWPIMPSFPGALLKYKNADGTANPKFAQIGQNDGAEIMIWMNYSGYNNDPITPAGTQVATGVTVASIPGSWDVWAARLQAEGDPDYPAWNVISYVRVDDGDSSGKPGVNAMTNFDANKFIQDAKNYDCPSEVRGTPTAGNACVADSWWLTSVQAGFEVWGKGTGLKVSEFSVKPNTDVSIDTGRVDGGKPIMHWQQKFLVTYKPTCEATSVAYTIVDTSADTADITGTLKKIVPDVEGTTDMWGARVGPTLDLNAANPNYSHGDVTITITPDCGSPTTINAYIDPSGHVVNTLGEPIENATVTLMYADGVPSTDPEPDPGAFSAVPDGSEIMSPDNRDNPDLTDVNGYYRWDVVDGWYKVQAEKTGCTSAESPALPVSDGNPATGVNLVLDCGSGGNDLLVQITPQNDWGTGYCSNVTITNNTADPVDWQVAFDVEGAIYDFWNVVWSQSGNRVTAEGVGWNNVLQAGESTHSIGFCANRSGSVPPTPGPGGVTVSVTTQSDWNTGYCANVTVTNTGSTPVDWTVSFPVVGTVNNMWNVIWSQSGNTITAEGVSWNNILQPGESSHDIGFCAAK